MRIPRYLPILLIVAAVALVVVAVTRLGSDPQVSEWADMPVAALDEGVEVVCGDEPFHPGTTTEFVSADGDVFSPAFPLGGEVPFVSARDLERDIAGTFAAEFVVPGGQAQFVLLSDFTFSAGQFEGVTEGCRVRNFSYVIDPVQGEPAFDDVIRITNTAAMPVVWRLVQSVDIVGARTESWSSDTFWLIPDDTPGTFNEIAVQVPDPFFEQ